MTPGAVLSSSQIRNLKRKPGSQLWNQVRDVCKHRRKWDEQESYRNFSASKGWCRMVGGNGTVSGTWIPKNAADTPVLHGLQYTLTDQQLALAGEADRVILLSPIPASLSHDDRRQETMRRTRECFLNLSEAFPDYTLTDDGSDEDDEPMQADFMPRNQAVLDRHRKREQSVSQAPLPKRAALGQPPFTGARQVHVSAGSLGHEAASRNNDATRDAKLTYQSVPTSGGTPCSLAATIGQWVSPQQATDLDAPRTSPTDVNNIPGMRWTGKAVLRDNSAFSSQTLDRSSSGAGVGVGVLASGQTVLQTVQVLSSDTLDPETHTLKNFRVGVSIDGSDASLPGNSKSKVSTPIDIFPKVAPHPYRDVRGGYPAAPHAMPPPLRPDPDMKASSPTAFKSAPGQPPRKAPVDDHSSGKGFGDSRGGRGKAAGRGGPGGGKGH